MFLSVKEYSKLMGLSRQAVSLQIIENRLSENVKAKKVGNRYVMYINEPKFIKVLKILNYDTSFI